MRITRFASEKLFIVMVSLSKRFGTFVRLLLLLLLVGCGKQPLTTKGLVNSQAKQEVAIAVASDLKYALDELLVDFKRAHPDVQAKATYGSSGNLFAQLSNRAPFDMYLSADIDYPRKLAEAGLTIPDTDFLYGMGKIVAWVRNESKLELPAQGIEVLLNPDVRKIAIANPAHAPYGRAAEAALKKLGIYERIKDRLVLGENIAQTAQFVESGAADVGIIALSLAIAPAMRDKGRYWQVPLDAYPPLEQGGVILTWTKNQEATELLRSFIIGKRGGAVLTRYGFLLPGE